MPPVKLQTNPRKWLPGRWAHLRQRMFDRRITARDAEIIKAFFDSGPTVPDLREAPQGWHKYLAPELLICGEGEFWKTLYTRSAPGHPRPKSVNLEEWEVRVRKPVQSETSSKEEGDL